MALLKGGNKIFCYNDKFGYNDAILKDKYSYFHCTEKVKTKEISIRSKTEFFQVCEVQVAFQMDLNPSINFSSLSK